MTILQPIAIIKSKKRAGGIIPNLITISLLPLGEIFPYIFDVCCPFTVEEALYIFNFHDVIILT